MIQIKKNFTKKITIGQLKKATAFVCKEYNIFVEGDKITSTQAERTLYNTKKKKKHW